MADALRTQRALLAENDLDVDRGLVFPALQRAGLRLSLVSDDLRHTAAAVRLGLGLPMEYVRREMGHKSITTTIRSYGHTLAAGFAIK